MLLMKKNLLVVTFLQMPLFSQLSFFIYHQYFGQNLEKFVQKIMRATPKSSTYGALHPKPCVALKNLIDHFVPYNPLNKLSVHHNSLGSIFFELCEEN